MLGGLTNYPVANFL